MKRFFKNVSILLLCGLLCSPIVEARGRNNTGSSQSQQTSNRTPDNGSRPGGSGNNNSGRPGNSGQTGNPGQPGNSNRPNTNGGNQGGNHGQQPGNSNRPNNNGGNHGGQQPGNNYQPGHGPGGQPEHGHGGNHSYGPGAPGYGGHPGWSNIHYGAPNRPMMPPPRPYHRPTPPPAFRPYPGCPTLSTILGVTFGTAINLTINSLLNRGITVTGYGPQTVYLSNVNQLNLFWPDATLFYNNGGLAASEFVYSTGYYDMSRYYNAYNSLVRYYGAPYTTSPFGNGGVSATWWGYNGQYVTLTYSPQYAANGGLRYFTTLSFGL